MMALALGGCRSALRDLWLGDGPACSLMPNVPSVARWSSVFCRVVTTVTVTGDLDRKLLGELPGSCLKVEVRQTVAPVIVQ